MPTWAMTASAASVVAALYPVGGGRRRTAESMDDWSVVYRPDRTASATETPFGMLAVWNVRATPARATRCGGSFVGRGSPPMTMVPSSSR